MGDNCEECNECFIGQECEYGTTRNSWTIECDYSVYLQKTRAHVAKKNAAKTERIAISFMNTGHNMHQNGFAKIAIALNSLDPVVNGVD